MYSKLLLIIFATSLFAGCASVPMETVETNNAAKEFNPPSEGNAGIYVYRAGTLGGALKKDIWIDEECVGESAPNVFFYTEVTGDETHKISTESEFSPNDLLLLTESGKNYFIRQYIKMGLFVGGANLELVNEAAGKAEVKKLHIARRGTCSTEYVGDHKEPEKSE